MLQNCSAARTILARVAESIVALCCVMMFTDASARAEQPFMTLDEKLSNAAWWVAAQFHPFTTDVRGIPVNMIRKSWCKATELRKDLLPRDVTIDEDGGLR